MATLPPRNLSSFRRVQDEVSALGPGLLATFGLAAVAVGGGKLLYGSGASPLMLAVILGVAVRTVVGAPKAIRAGVQFSQKRLLRIAIILLGVQLTFADITHLSAAVLTLIVVSVVCTFIVSCWVGWLLGIDAGLNRLIAAGASICGISAIVATNTVVKASDEDVTYAIATATAFGSISIFVYPLLAVILSLPPLAYATWVGASIHEVAQVIAAGFIYSEDAGEVAVLVKLTRVLMLVPMVMTLAWTCRAERSCDLSGGVSVASTVRDVPLPLFIIGFIVMIGINSAELMPPAIKASLTFVSGFLFAMALVALGLETDLKNLQQRGLRPLVAGILAWAFIAAFSLGLVLLVWTTEAPY